MKASGNIKAVIKLGALMLLSLWVGYTFGYRHGVRDDQREWWASAQLKPDGSFSFVGPQAKAEFEPYFVRQNQIPDKFDR